MNTYIIKTEHRKHRVGNGFLVHNLIPGYGKEIGEKTSPFLMFDYNPPTQINPQPVKNPQEQPQRRGVGAHPHKGFETVTIVYSGNIEHRDSKNNSDTINPGDAQWMTAGSGIIHQEYFSPKFNLEGGISEFAQIWINLPKNRKELPPQYQPITASNIPILALTDYASLHLIAGRYHHLTGPAQTQSTILLGHISFSEKSTQGKGNGIYLDIPTDQKGYLFVRNGQVEIDGNKGSTSTLFETNELTGPIHISSKGSADILFFSGEPLGDPVYHYGPFVMDSKEGLERAFEAYENGGFGEIVGKITKKS